ncbi:MAG: 1-deoxy-D-xylulose-5-phosphate synthase [Pirellulales bacterium]
MSKLLANLESPLDLRKLTTDELEVLADEIREVLCNLVSTRSAHFASNLGVVELCLALHLVYDFREDRLIWDTGHQIYPHKLITGRYGRFGSIRTKGGLMGYPNPAESPYDLFMTGHAGCSVSTVLGLRSGDRIMGHDHRHAVAVIGDGAFPSGIVYEAMNNIGGLREKMLVILNDNKMSICPRVGGLANYLDRLRTNPYYTGLKSEVVKMLSRVPVFGDPAERFLAQVKEAAKAGLHGGMLFEDLGFRYIGPIDGHNIPLLKKYLEMTKAMSDPVLLHVVTEKGHGYQPAAADPVFFHTPPVLAKDQALGKDQSPAQDQPEVLPAAKSIPAYTNVARDALLDQMGSNHRVTVMTAAMCQGNKLEPVRDRFPDRFFDVGICESHAVAFAAGQAKAGLRPVVVIYSTFLQRSFDQVFQEVSLQNLPVVFMMDRGGLTGPDGPTHHGVFDLAYMRIFPNLVVMAPGDEHDLRAMLPWALDQDQPVAIRYPKANAERIGGTREPIVMGRAEQLRDGSDGALLCCGTQLPACLEAAERLSREGIQLTVVNARFAKPLDRELIGRLLRDLPFVVTIEEGCLMGGFGSAVLELACDEGWDTRHLRRLGIPDHYVEHAERTELLSDLGLDAAGIADTCRELVACRSSRSS